jgi:hypothetical protein
MERGRVGKSERLSGMLRRNVCLLESPNAYLACWTERVPVGKSERLSGMLGRNACVLESQKTYLKGSLSYGLKQICQRLISTSLYKQLVKQASKPLTQFVLSLLCIA